MANRIVRSRFRGGAVRRKTTWSGTGVSAVGMQPVAISSKVLLTSHTGAFLEDIAPATLVRVRGQIGVESDQTAAVEQQTGALGIAVVSEQARAAGAASLPGPQTNSDWDGWLWWYGFSYRLQVLSQSGMNPNFVHEIVVDSKAMRKIGEQDALVYMAENASASHVFNVAVNTRELWKLH